MDEGYLEWLQVLPGFDEEKARRVAERFPTFDDLLHAGRGEVPTVAAPSALHPATLPPPALLCATRGAPVTRGSSRCNVCGPAYRPEEAALLPGLDAFLEEESSL